MTTILAVESTDMPDCLNCGRFVTHEFARVFGDEQHRVSGCPDCTVGTDLKDGGATSHVRDSQTNS
jgi:hypothetical protein